MLQLRSLGILLVLASGLATGCSDGSSDAGTGSSGDDGSGGRDGDGDGDDGRGGSDDDDDGAGDDGGDGDAGPTPACARYLDCLAAVDPAQLSDAQNSVGDDGVCWDGDQARRESCDQGCRAGLAEERRSAPDETRCDDCTTDADCGGGSARCVERFENGAPLRTCVGCVSDADCTDGACRSGVCEAGGCLERIMDLYRAVADGDACTLACIETLGEGCTEAELCCITTAQGSCDGDRACAEQSCGATPACSQRWDEVESCALACQ